MSISNSDLSARQVLYETVSKKGRQHTAQKLNRKIIEQQCSLAAVRARDLFADKQAEAFKETAHLAKLLSRIYIKLLEIYQESTPIIISSQENQGQQLLEPSLATWGIPRINRLAAALSPLLSELQAWNQSTNNWRFVGFATSQINLTNALLLEQLTLSEQVFLRCYFKFLEEQVALPWQRMCTAALEHLPHSTPFALIKRMLPMTTAIATVVHQQWSEQFPNYSSRRGFLTNPAVRYSSIRDFEMFQVYLWLCFLTKTMIFVEQELFAICSIVYGALNIPWTMTVDGTSLLVNELLSRLEPEEKTLVYPYAQAMINAFATQSSIGDSA